jgi:hypothetical protein
MFWQSWQCWRCPKDIYILTPPQDIEEYCFQELSGVETQTLEGNIEFYPELQVCLHCHLPLFHMCVIQPLTLLEAMFFKKVNVLETSPTLAIPHYIAQHCIHVRNVSRDCQCLGDIAQDC